MSRLELVQCLNVVICWGNFLIDHPYSLVIVTQYTVDAVVDAVNELDFMASN